MIIQKEKGFAPLLIVLIIVLIGAAGFLGYQVTRPKTSTPTTPQAQPVKKPLSSKVPAKISQKIIPPRSKAPGVISAAITAHGYNPQTGSAIKPDKYFSPKDRQLYLALNINKPKVGTHIEYVRYLQGKYLDHRSIRVAQPNWKYAYFGWTNKSGKEHKKGIYRVRVYSNGILEKKVNYIVRTQ